MATYDHPVDQGWSWVVAFASAGLNLIHGGTMSCFGILKLEMMTAYQCDSSCTQDVTLWVLSAASMFMLIAGTFITLILSKTSHRVVGIFGGLAGCVGIILTAVAPNCYFMFFSLAVVFAAGTGAVDLVAVTVFAPYFFKHRALAIGIVGAGAGIGGIVCPQIITYLFEAYSFKGALICYSAFYANAIVLAALLRPTSAYRKLPAVSKTLKSSDAGETSSRRPSMGSQILGNEITNTPIQPEITNTEYNWTLWYNPKALLLAVALFFAQNSKGLVLATTPSYGDEFGVSQKVVATVISSTNAIQIVTRIANGWFADRKIIPAFVQFALLFTFSAVAGILAVVFPGLIGLCIVYVTLAVFGNAVVSLTPIVIIDLLGVRNLETMSGICNVYEGFAFISNAFTANALYGKYGTWIVVFYFIASCYLASAIITCGLYAKEYFSKEKKKAPQEL